MKGVVGWQPGRRRVSAIVAMVTAAAVVLPLYGQQGTMKFVAAFQPQSVRGGCFGRSSTMLSSSSDGQDEAERLQGAAERLRNEIADLEKQMGRRPPPPTPPPPPPRPASVGLQDKRVLVVGANGRLGSMVCRYLLRQDPTTKVVAAVHRLSESSADGFARLSLEVGAEDGRGQIRPFWQGRFATFEFTPEMASYHLQNLRVVPLELMDPLQCETVVEEFGPLDAVVWCATEFSNGANAWARTLFPFVPRNQQSVEVEGFRNVLQPFVQGRTTSDLTQVVLISTAEEAQNSESEMDRLKRQGEAVLTEFPNWTSWTVLQMTRLDDFFAEEGLDLLFSTKTTSTTTTTSPRIISRRDAARAAVKALTMPELRGAKVQVSAIPSTEETTTVTAATDERQES